MAPTMILWVSWFGMAVPVSDVMKHSGRFVHDGACYTLCNSNIMYYLALLSSMVKKSPSL